MSSVIRRKTCRVCESVDLQCVLKIPATPGGDLYVTAQELNKNQEVYSLDLFLCRKCSALQLVDVVDPKILYGNYIYKTSISLGLAKHFDQYAQEVLKYLNISSSVFVIDIGSNDGTLLCAFKKRDCKVLGIDPAPEAVKDARAKGIDTLQAYFDSSVAADVAKKYGQANIITANNVFANIDPLGDFLAGIKNLLTPEGVFVFETGYLADLIEGRLVDVIYHEHLTYFSVKSLQKLFLLNGMELIEAQHISSKGGSLRCIAQLKGGRYKKSSNIQELIDLEAKLEADQSSTFKQIESEMTAIKNGLLAHLKKLKKEGKTVAGYGASVGVTTLLYLFGMDEVLDFIVDDNPDRHGRFTPGHHIPVFSSDEIYKRKPACVVIFAWRYKEPIMNKHQKYLESGGQFIVPLPKVEVYDAKNFVVANILRG